MQIDIAGGGIIGLSIAWRLAQRGVAVRVWDAGPMAGEASWAGAGMLAPGGEFRSDSRWARLAVESLAEFGSFVKELEDASGQSIDFRVCGAVEVAFCENEANAIQQAADRQKLLGIAVGRISLEEAWARAPGLSNEIRAAWWFPNEAVVDPREVCAALIQAGRRIGVEYRQNAPLFHVRPPMVIAAGAWSSQFPELGSFVQAVPVKGHLLGYSLHPGSLGPIVRNGHFYALQRRTGFTLFGADSFPGVWEHEVQPEAKQRLEAEARRLLPGLLGGSPDTCWAGLRPGSATGEPVVEKVPGQDVWLAYGHYRNGILLAPVTARLIETAVAASLGKG